MVDQVAPAGVTALPRGDDGVRARLRRHLERARASRAQLRRHLRRRLPRTSRSAAQLVENWNAHRASGLAAEVAFWGMVSVFPTLLALTAMLGFLDQIASASLAERAQREVVGFLREVLTDEADTIVDAVGDLFDRPSPGVLTVGVALALWAASRGFAGVIRALDVAYDLPEQRGWLHQRLVGLGLALGTVVVIAFMLAMLLVGPLLGAGGSAADSVGLGPGFAAVWVWLRWPAVLLVALGWATTVFHVAPNQRTPWRWDAIGALVTAVSWIVVSIGFRLYLDTVGSTNEVFGVLGGAIIALVWLYLLAVGLLLGGEVNGLLTSMRRHAGTQAAPEGEDGDEGPEA